MGGQAAVNPAAFQSGVIGVGQTRSNEIGTPTLDRFSALFAAYRCVRAGSIFVFSLRVLVVYTSVEEIHFSPLWVDGLRWRAGHCCFWGAIQNGIRRSDLRTSRP